MTRLIGGATDIVALGDCDHAEIKRRMRYGDTRRLVGMFSGPTAMPEYLAGVLELNVVALRGPGFGCTIEHDHGDPALRCETPAVTREVLDSLDPDDAETIIDAIAERNQSLRRQVRPGTSPFATPSSSSSATPSSDMAAASPGASPISSSAAPSAGATTS